MRLFNVFMSMLFSADGHEQSTGSEIHDVTYDTSQMPVHLQLFNVLLQVSNVEIVCDYR